ncbi:MAG: 3-deoxy-D-manno-octulosonic acid transferase [Bacteroidia bacterium]|nr:3-deoxy-D-manno-octulosonic acid transferase [Bacteroidia bacterium]
MNLIYNISIYLYRIAIGITSLFNKKAQLWIDGRKDIFKKLEIVFSKKQTSIIWVHCASLGEFEQGRPLIEEIKRKHPNYSILLTFFSPSGYEVRKNYQGADYIFYLPIDTPTNTDKFLDIVKPAYTFFVKYEFWFNYLNALKKRKIPTYLVSGIFRDDHHFFKPYGKWSRKQLACFNHFFVQNKHSEELLQSIGYTNTTVTGDTRFDRVSEIAKTVKRFDLIEQFCKDHPVFIAGSTWNEDEQILAQSSIISMGYKLIIAPHEIDEKHIDSIIRQFKTGSPETQCIRYSELTEKNDSLATILIIDNIGMLSSLYQYGKLAYIGGGFGKGIHNILEAATFGLPVIFGPNYQKFTEAKELIEQKGAFSISSEAGLNNILNLLHNESALKNASTIAKNYVESNTGATSKILSHIQLK